jgi:hypothetical protein
MFQTLGEACAGHPRCHRIEPWRLPGGIHSSPIGLHGLPRPPQTRAASFKRLYPKRPRGLDPEPLLQLPVPPDLLQATVGVKAIKCGPGAPDDTPKCRVRQRYAPGRTSLSPRLGKSAKASLVDQSDMAATGGARRVQVQFRACRTSRESGSSGDTKVSSTS